MNHDIFTTLAWYPRDTSLEEGEVFLVAPLTRHTDIYVLYDNEGLVTFSCGMSSNNIRSHGLIRAILV